MRYLKPQYYDEFKCTADQCPDTCCAGWQIMIDDDSLEKYEQMQGEFRERLLTGIDWREGSFLQHCGRCSMLNEKNLCDLVTACGEEALCETCGRYPRHVEEYEGLREWSLSLSCPVAAQMILDRTEPMQFVVTEDDEEDPLEEEFEDFDFFLFTQLEDARNVMFDIAQNRKMPMEERLRSILKLAEEMQDCLDEDRLYDMDEVISKYSDSKALHESEVLQEVFDGGIVENELFETDGEQKVEKYIARNSVENTEKRRYEELQRHFPVFYQMERLREEWTDVIEEAQNTLFTDYDFYQEIRSAFLAEYGPNGAHHVEWEILQENLLMFFLYTYFSGTVYDDWIYSKAALSAFSVVFVSEFVMCRWIHADNHIDKQDFIELAYRYAREVEHSDDNLNLLEEWLQENKFDLWGMED